MKSKGVAEGLTMMSTAFGFVAALAWNEAIKTLINEFIPRGQGMLSLFVYAIFVTIIAIIVTARLAKIKSRFDDGEPAR